MALKKRLHSAKGKWVDELPGVLWAFRTTSQRLTGVSPFSLTYGMEAIIPTKTEMPTIRTEVPGMDNAKAISKDLDIASYQQKMANLYNKHIKSRAF